MPFCILVAFGFDAASSGTVFRWPTWVVVGSVGLNFVYLVSRLPLPRSGAAAWQLWLLAAFAAFAALSFAALRLKPGWRSPLMAIVLVAMVAEYSYYLNRVRPARTAYDFSMIASVAFLRARLGEGRILNVGSRGVPPNWGMALELPQIDSLDAMSLRWYQRFFDERFGMIDQFAAIRGPRSREPVESRGRFDLSALDLLGVRFVVVTRSMGNFLEYFDAAGFERVLEEPRISIFENPGTLPRARLADRLVLGPGIPTDHGFSAWTTTMTEDPGLVRQAQRLGISTAQLGAVDPTHVGGGVAKITRSRNADVTVEVAHDRAAILVLADTWHPSWRVTIDGVEAPLGRVDEILRGVAVPAGRHLVVFTYRPRTLTAGGIVSFLTLSVLASSVAGATIRERRRAVRS
jgi:hypothetical protein